MLECECGVKQECIQISSLAPWWPVKAGIVKETLGPTLSLPPSSQVLHESATFSVDDTCHHGQGGAYPQ